ncbi:MAG: hypothetical protein ABI411_14705 [Tahibacter sp.]
MTISLVISMAGLDDSLERRVVMAAKLLGASRINARIEPWDGTRRDILVADMSDAYGRTAYAVARRRKDAVLPISRTGGALDDGTVALSSSCQVVELQNRLREIALQIRTPVTDDTGLIKMGAAPDAVLGLLELLTKPGAASGGDFVAKYGTYSVVIRRSASRIIGRSHSDLVAAKSNLCGSAWSARPAGRDDLPQSTELVSMSLDAFLITACELHERKLPPFPGRHQLGHWPDLGTLTDNVEAMQLSALLSRNKASVDELALRTNIEKARINAFCWAMSASGLFDSTTRQSVAITDQAPPEDAPRSIISRLARRFGILFGAESTGV